MTSSRISLVARIALAPLVVLALYLLKANVWFRLYPVLVVAVALVVFAISLWRTPLVEVFARRMGETLDARGVVYCRRVTVVWTVFLSIHLVVTFLTVFASHETWALYNGVLAYLMMGALFVGEWLFRRRYRRG